MTLDGNGTRGYANDGPESDPSRDRFRRSPFADRIADTLATREDTSSLVLAVYGAWGEGKTTVLNFMRQRFAKHPNVVCLPFNPWRFSDEPTLLRGFFDSLAHELDRSIKTGGEKVRQVIRDYAKIVEPFIPTDKGSKVFRWVAERVGSKADPTLEEAKRRVGAMLSESGKRVVVMIDDLDRLEPEEVHATLRLVKLTADFPRTAYIIACDDEMVARALGRRYGSDDEGRRFLEKIVQVPLHLPISDKQSLRALCLEGIQEAINRNGIDLSEDAVRHFVMGFDNGIAPALTTPRMAKRYANAVEFALPLLKDEVHPGDLLLVEGMRVFFPVLYDAIRRNQTAVLGDSASLSWGNDAKREKDKQKADVEAMLAALESDVRDSARDLLMALFPQLKGVFGNMHYGGDWEERWTNDRRVCSQEYFKRYFAYTIPAGDLADREAASIVERVTAADPVAGAALLEPVLSADSTEVAFRKLRTASMKLPPEKVPAFARALAVVGPKLPSKSLSVFDLGGVYVRVAILVRHLIERSATDETRLTLAREVVLERADISFATECFRWMRRGERDKGLLSDADEGDLRAQLVARIERESQTGQPLYDRSNGTFLLWLWARERDRSVTTKYLEQCFNADKAALDKFILAFASVPQDVETGAMLAPELSREQFDTMAVVIDPQTLTARLKERFGGELTAEGDPALARSSNGDVVRLARRIFTFATATPPVAPPREDNGATPSDAPSSDPEADQGD